MKKLLFVISQLYKGGAETALVNLLNNLDYTQYSVDLLIMNQCPIKGAVSLIDRINNKVCICDAYAEDKKNNFLKKIKNRFVCNEMQKQLYFSTALDFVYGKKYDWAFFVGEWCSPSFVALEVTATVKAAWIHSDISVASYFNAENYFSYFDRFDYFIFVSKHSMDSAVQAFPFLRDKAVTIYNINDVQYIKKRAKDEVEDIEKSKLPIVLTCANIRPEKNHLRQVEVMAELKRRGIEFYWINIGSTANKPLVDKVISKCREYGLEDRFLVLGPKENPYKYIRMADIITVLSDHESWSMVITEAKILGKPVVSTKTSGGLEQIIDQETGMLADFDVISIANAMEMLILNLDLYEKIKKNLNNFDNTQTILNDFNNLILKGVSAQKNKDILYVIDDINYKGGAHEATKLQIKTLMREGRKITVFSSTIPNLQLRRELRGCNFIALRDSKADRLYNDRLLRCLLDKNLSFSWKKLKLKWSMRGYLKKLNYEKDVLSYVSEIFLGYPIVCVMSENSNYRGIVASLNNTSKKIQWIHTDYAGWYRYNEWTASITLHDSELYSNFDYIVLLSENIRKKFIEIYPHLAKKTFVSANLMPEENIRAKAKPVAIKNSTPIYFITIGRMGNEKEYPRLIRILKRLYQKGYNFDWTIVGGGEEFQKIEKMINQADLSSIIHLTGALDNPFQRLAKADIFALLSSYEGLPNTIFEALILGIPVLATNVGGISTQIEDGVTGWLVDNDERKIEEKIQYLLLNQEDIFRLKKNLKEYTYNNEVVINNINNIFKQI